MFLYALEELATKQIEHKNTSDKISITHGEFSWADYMESFQFSARAEFQPG
jgi:hypothetical protein